jgi:hypothetical protein
MGQLWICNPHHPRSSVVDLFFWQSDPERLRKARINDARGSLRGFGTGFPPQSTAIAGSPQDSHRNSRELNKAA